MNLTPLKLSVTTCYLIKAGGGYVLVDTGYEEDWSLFQKRLKDAGVSIAQISHIILTHHHDDHCGLLHHILQENSTIRVVMSKQCSELIQKGENDRTHGGGLLNKRVAFLILRGKQIYVSLHLHKKVDRSKNLKFQPYMAREQDIVYAGEPTLRDLGIPLDGRIIETPGHTVDSISLLFPDGDCLVGDAAAHMLPIAGTRYCVIFICNMDEYYKSWEKLIKAGARRIFPAHGNVFPVNRLIENIGKNKAENIVPYR